MAHQEDSTLSHLLPLAVLLNAIDQAHEAISTITFSS